MNSVIKLYSPQSELSYVADEILDIRSNIKSLKIELRDKISLKIGDTYELTINRGDLLRVRFSFIYLDSRLIRIPINHDDEQKIQSLRSKKPFQIKLLDENNNCLAKGMFYRYKTRCSSTRSTNPKEWDSNFFPEKHKIYEQEIIADNDSHFIIVRQISNEHGSLETKKDFVDILNEQKRLVQTKTILDKNCSKSFFNSKNYQEFLSFLIKFTILYILFDFIKLALSQL